LNLLQQLEDLVSLADIDRRSVDCHQRDQYDTGERCPDSEFHENLRSGYTQQHTPRISVLASWAAGWAAADTCTTRGNHGFGPHSTAPPGAGYSSSVWQLRSCTSFA